LCGAPGNTLKRVAIIFTTVLVFKNPVSQLSVIGSTIAITGALIYSLVRAREKQAEKGVPAASG